MQNSLNSAICRKLSFKHVPQAIYDNHVGKKIGSALLKFNQLCQHWGSFSSVNMDLLCEVTLGIWWFYLSQPQEIQVWENENQNYHQPVKSWNPTRIINQIVQT